MASPIALPADPDPIAAELIAARPQFSAHAMDGLLLESVPLAAIADALGTPAWVYGAGTIRARYRHLAEALAPLGAHIHYAMKANDHLAILRVLSGAGAGMDVVSQGELRRARAAGIPPDRIVFSGVGKSEEEMREAIASGVAQINAESAEELAMLSALAAGMGATARVALRINPDVDAGTHPKITTGRAENKFGIPYADAPELYTRATSLPGLAPVGLALHIGSQILGMAPYRAAYARAAELVQALRARGLAVESVDCGGGLGIPYRNEPAPAPEALAGAIRVTLGDLGLRLMVEPGRWLVGPAGVLLASIRLVKHARKTGFMVLDAAMNDLVRPAMYDSWHGIVPLAAAHLPLPAAPVDVVGPVCETGDTFARARALPPMPPGARVAILDAGAYGAVMSSTYNARPPAAAAMVDGGEWAVIRARPRVETLWRDEIVPDFLMQDFLAPGCRAG